MEVMGHDASDASSLDAFLCFSLQHGDLLPSFWREIDLGRCGHARLTCCQNAKAYMAKSRDKNVRRITVLDAVS